MAVSFFDNKAVVPDVQMVADALKDTYPYWEQLQSHVQANYPSITGEWKHYGKKAGWTYKLISKKRNLLFFIPLNGCFKLRIVLGEKAASRAQATAIPNEIKEAIRTAASHIEGRSIDIDIGHHEQLEAVEQLLKIKSDI